MPVTQILLIRHAEKPSVDGSILGVSEVGVADENELSVRGWQRAGALCRFFSSIDSRASNAGLQTPRFLFAAGVTAPVRSLRAQHTLKPLSRLLGCAIDKSHMKGEEAQLATAVQQCDGAVLVCWEHHALASIAQQFPGVAAQLPKHPWPDDRFDVVWLLRPSAQGWRFSQVPQLLLAGDVDQGV
jgi:hypothetical protein